MLTGVDKHLPNFGVTQKLSFVGVIFQLPSVNLIGAIMLFLKIFSWDSLVYFVAVTDVFAQSFVFDSSDEKMLYSIRDPMCNKVYHCDKPHGYAKEILIRLAHLAFIEVLSFMVMKVCICSKAYPGVFQGE